MNNYKQKILNLLNSQLNDNYILQLLKRNFLFQNTKHKVEENKLFQNIIIQLYFHPENKISTLSNIIAVLLRHKYKKFGEQLENQLLATPIKVYIHKNINAAIICQERILELINAVYNTQITHFDFVQEYKRLNNEETNKTILVNFIYHQMLFYKDYD